MKSVNIFKYFPIEDDKMLEEFMKKDEDYEERIQQLYTVFIPAISDKQGPFGNAIIKAIFSIPYLLSHRWPTTA